MERIHVKVPGEQPQDREYMKQALALAEKGQGWVNPNPMVGAVLVKDGRIIGEGYHTRYGQLHAEREAFKNAAAMLEGMEHFGHVIHGFDREDAVFAGVESRTSSPLRIPRTRL